MLGVPVRSPAHRRPIPVTQSPARRTFRWILLPEHLRQLHRIRELMDLLGNPQRAYQSIHIAGTNGKGSPTNTTRASAAVAISNRRTTSGVATMPASSTTTTVS